MSNLYSTTLWTGYFLVGAGITASVSQTVGPLFGPAASNRKKQPRAKDVIFASTSIPGTIVPIHRHHGSNEINICLRGHYEEYLYGFTKTRSDGTPDPDSFGIVETIDMYPGGPVLSIEKEQWHSLKCLESGTVLFEAKDGPYAPLAEDEILES